MRCETFEWRLNEVLDQRRPLSSASDVEEHIRQCGSCRELARSYESVLSGLAQAAVPAESTGLTQRVLVEVSRPSTILFPRRRARLALAAAAALVAAVGVSWMFNGAGRRGEALHDGPTVDRHRLVDAELPGKTDLATQGASAKKQPLEEPSGGEHVRAEVLSPMPQATALLDPALMKADELLGSLPGTEWAQEVADGLQPVTRPTVGAINGFLHLWGVGDEGRRS